MLTMALGNIIIEASLVSQKKESGFIVKLRRKFVCCDNDTVVKLLPSWTFW